MKVVVPAYFPAGQSWLEILGIGSKLAFTIFNPQSGVGSTRNTDYRNIVKQYKDHGAPILGYVATHWGKRSMWAIFYELWRYRIWYQPSGIFFDEVSTQDKDLPYYRHLCRMTRMLLKPGLVMLNPGIHPDANYLDIADAVVCFEGSAEAYAQWIPPAWMQAHNQAQFVHLIHSADAQILPLLRQRAPGMAYVTERTLPNPWDQLPAQWPPEFVEF